MEDNQQKTTVCPPDISELKQIIKNRFSFDRRKMIFFTLNSCLLGLAVFSLFSSITLESNSQIFRIRYILTLKGIPSSIRSSCGKAESILIPQNLAQLCTIVCGVIGFFGIYQKSKKILFMYPLSLALSLAFRIASTIVILVYYNTLENVFGLEVNTFIVIEVLFLLIDILISIVCYVQFMKAQVEYFIVTKDKERLITDSTMAYEVIKNIIKN